MDETYTGDVRDGAVGFDAGVAPPGEGARARVELGQQPTRPRTLADRLASVVGRAEGLPPDLAEQHDHYLHGQPKR